MNELDFYDDEEMALLEAPKRRRKRRKNPEPATIAMATPILLLAAGYLAWCGYKQYKTGAWTWEPWKGTIGRRRLPLARPIRQNNYADLDRATEAMMRPRPSVQEVDLWRRPRHDALEKEVVSFITP